MGSTIPNNAQSQGHVTGLPPTWDKLLDSTNGDEDGCNSDRFICVMGDRAVLDNETGLVWDRIFIFPQAHLRNLLLFCPTCSETVHLGQLVRNRKDMK